MSRWCNVGDAPPSIRFQLGTAPQSNHFLVPVSVTNRGDEPAEGVHIEVVLADRGKEQESGEFDIVFPTRHPRRLGDIFKPIHVAWNKWRRGYLALKTLNSTDLRKAKHETGRDSWQARACWGRAAHRHWYWCPVQEGGEARHYCDAVRHDASTGYDSADCWTTLTSVNILETITGRKRRKCWPAARFTLENLSAVDWVILLRNGCQG